MTQRVRFKRGRRGQDANVAETYPQPSGGSRKRNTHRRGERVPAEDAEPWAIDCFQCGQPLEDERENAVCPFCGSDNMIGREL